MGWSAIGRGRRVRVGRLRARTVVALSAFSLGLVSGCDILGPDVIRRFTEPRLYVHDLFESEAECRQVQEAYGWINCSQLVSFCPDGRAELMVTDIIHPGTYRIERNAITVTLPENPEVERTVRFTLSADEQSITEVSGGTVWTIDAEPGAEAWRCPGA